MVENQVNQQELVVTVTDPKQSVYFYNCSGSVVQVKGKCNAISIDKCQKTGVVFEHVIALCELVNCSSVQVSSMSKLVGSCADGCQRASCCCVSAYVLIERSATTGRHRGNSVA